MNHILDSIERSLQHNNYAAALAQALTLPDICGWLLGIGSTRERFTKFFDDHLARHYVLEVGARSRRVEFMSAADLYALRCAYLHQGSSDLSGQKAAGALQKFELVAAEGSSFLHCNRLPSNVLQIDVPTFCRQLAEGARSFLAASNGDQSVRDRLGKLGEIRVIGDVL
jgi:hypothetical protein